MSRTRAAPLLMCAALAVACREESGLDVVRVPESAYLSPDASKPVRVVTSDAGSDAAAFMVCVQAPPSDGEDEDKGESTEPKPDSDSSTDFPDCPAKYEGRPLDPRTTQRHREHDDERACCYRPKGSQPQPVRGGRGE